MEIFKVRMWKDIPKFLKERHLENNRYKKGDYMKVYLFDSFDEMYDEVDRIENTKLERNYCGRCLCFTKDYVDKEGNTVKYSPYCGDLYFVKGEMAIATVVHEINHAVIGYFNRKIENYCFIFDGNTGLGKPITSDRSIYYEELFCYMSGTLINQICDYVVAKNEEK